VFLFSYSVPAYKECKMARKLKGSEVVAAMASADATQAANPDPAEQSLHECVQALFLQQQERDDDGVVINSGDWNVILIDPCNVDGHAQAYGPFPVLIEGKQAQGFCPVSDMAAYARLLYQSGAYLNTPPVPASIWAGSTKLMSALVWKPDTAE
jgi:hypothetical protein